MIVSTRVWALGEPADDAARQVALSRRNLCAPAINFAETGFTPPIDTLMPNREHLDDLVNLLAPRPIMLIVLSLGADACRYRDSIRRPEERFDFDRYGALDASMKAGFGDVGWWLDPSILTPDETADRIVREAHLWATLDRPSSAG